MNWTVMILVGMACVALIIFLIVKNKKDKKDLEEKIKNDYPKPKDETGDIEIDKVLK